MALISLFNGMHLPMLGPSLLLGQGLASSCQARTVEVDGHKLWVSAAELQDGLAGPAWNTLEVTSAADGALVASAAYRGNSQQPAVMLELAFTAGSKQPVGHKVPYTAALKACRDLLEGVVPDSRVSCSFVGGSLCNTLAEELAAAPRASRQLRKVASMPATSGGVHKTDPGTAAVELLARANKGALNKEILGAADKLLKQAKANAPQ